MSFGSVIRERRTALGIGLNDFAERLIERDQENPPRDELIQSAAAILGVRMDDLFVEAQRLPPDMRKDMAKVVQAYRRLRFVGKG